LHRRQHSEVRTWCTPEVLPPIGVAVSGRRPCEIAGRLGDLVIATEPRTELLPALRPL